ncbi:MAG: ATP-binding protein, partial [Traorella sp.]
MKYKISINHEKCIGCGNCIKVCSNSVLQLINGKVHVINEKRCDVQGYCMKMCPCDAIYIEKKVKEYCVGDECQFDVESELYNWPVQITSVSCNNRYLEDGDLLIAADCAAYAYANFHSDFIKDHVVLIACPKNDLTNHLLEKCVALFQNVHFN